MINSNWNVSCCQVTNFLTAIRGSWRSWSLVRLVLPRGQVQQLGMLENGGFSWDLTGISLCSLFNYSIILPNISPYQPTNAWFCFSTNGAILGHWCFGSQTLNLKAPKWYPRSGGKKTPNQIPRWVDFFNTKTVTCFVRALQNTHNHMSYMSHTHILHIPILHLVFGIFNLKRLFFVSPQQDTTGLRGARSSWVIPKLRDKPYVQDANWYGSTSGWKEWE